MFNLNCLFTVIVLVFLSSTNVIANAKKNVVSMNNSVQTSTVLTQNKRKAKQKRPVSAQIYPVLLLPNPRIQRKNSRLISGFMRDNTGTVGYRHVIAIKQSINNKYLLLVNPLNYSVRKAKK